MNTANKSFIFAHQVKMEGTHYPDLTFLVDNLRNERFFAHSDPSREAELLFSELLFGSPGRKELSTRIIPRKISHGNQQGSAHPAHPAGFLSLDSLHSSMGCSF